MVVGGGIAGLAAAYRLARAAPHAVVTLLESSPHLGGKITTQRVADFVIEGGPDSFLARKPRGLGLCRELGLEPRLQGTNPNHRRTYIMRGGRLYDLPEGLSGLIPTRLGPLARTTLISPWGKLRMGLDYLLPAKRDSGDESLAEFVVRRLGRELYERLVEPLLSGIYAGDGANLSLAATVPQLRQAERAHGSLIRSLLAAQREAPALDAGSARSAFLTLEAGLAEIVEALEARMTGRVTVRLNTPVSHLSAVPGGYQVQLASAEALNAEAVIVATPAFVTADLLAGLDAEAASALRSIPHVSTATVSVAYRMADLPRQLDGYGYLIPRAENRPVLACTWTSTKFPHRAPPGFALIRAFVGSAGRETVLENDDETLVGLVRAELRRTLGVTAAPRLQRVFRWPRAMPQYTVGHLDRLAALEQRLAAFPGLLLAGNGYRGVGLPDCIASGEAAAEAAAKHLSTISEAPQLVAQ